MPVCIKSLLRCFELRTHPGGAPSTLALKVAAIEKTIDDKQEQEDAQEFLSFLTGHGHEVCYIEMIPSS